MTQSRDMAVPKPLFIMSGPHLSGYRVSLGYETLNEAQDAHEALSALANRDAPGSGLGSSAKADPHRDAEGAVVGLYEQIGSVRVGKGDLLDHLLVSLSEQDAAAAIEEIACLVRRPLTPNVLELVQYVSWALEEGQPINDEHIVALLDAIKDTRNPTLSQQAAPLDDRTAGYEAAEQRSAHQTPDTKEGSEP